MHRHTDKQKFDWSMPITELNSTGKTILNSLRTDTQWSKNSNRRWLTEFCFWIQLIYKNKLIASFYWTVWFESADRIYSHLNHFFFLIGFNHGIWARFVVNFRFDCCLSRNFFEAKNSKKKRKTPCVVFVIRLIKIAD